MPPSSQTISSAARSYEFEMFVSRPLRLVISNHLREQNTIPLAADLAATTALRRRLRHRPAVSDRYSARLRFAAAAGTAAGLDADEVSG